MLSTSATNPFTIMCGLPLGEDNALDEAPIRLQVVVAAMWVDVVSVFLSAYRLLSMIFL